MEGKLFGGDLKVEEPVNGLGLDFSLPNDWTRLDVAEVALLRDHLTTWLRLQASEPAKGEKSELAPVSPELSLQLQRQEANMARLEAAFAAVPAMLERATAAAVERALTKVAPILAEHAAAAQASLRPGGDQGYMGRDGAWRTPMAVNYDGPPQGGLMGMPAPPSGRVEHP